jgi:hypothetical protein
MVSRTAADVLNPIRDIYEVPTTCLENIVDRKLISLGLYHLHLLPAVDQLCQR